MAFVAVSPFLYSEQAHMVSLTYPVAPTTRNDLIALLLQELSRFSDQEFFYFLV